MNDHYNYYSAGGSADTSIKRNVAIGMIAIIVLLALSIGMFFAPPARADDMKPASCFIGASVGTAASANRIDSTVRLDIGGTAPLLSAELGCKLMPTASMSILGIVRADLQRLGVATDTTTISSRSRYMAVLAPVINLNSAMDIYAGPLVSMSQISVKDWRNTNVTGYGLAAGLDFDIGKTGFRGFVEYDWISSRSYDAAGSIVKPNESLFRIGGRFGF